MRCFHILAFVAACLVSTTKADGHEGPEQYGGDHHMMTTHLPEYNSCRRGMENCKMTMHQAHDMTMSVMSEYQQCVWNVPCYSEDEKHYQEKISNSIKETMEKMQWDDEKHEYNSSGHILPQTIVLALTTVIGRWLTTH